MWRYTMKTIGILGGLSYQSTLTYYQRINEKINEKLGFSHSARIILYSFDFEEVELLQHRNDWNTLEKIMVEKALVLEQAQVQLLAIASNTMHFVDQAINQSCRIPLVHIAKEVAAKVSEDTCKKVLLLGTKFTMSSTMYSSYLREYGIECVLPNQRDQDVVHSVIYNELIIKKPSMQSKKDVEAILKNHPEVDGVILGCTELPLLNIEAKGMRVYDTTEIHCDAIVRESLKAD